MAFRITMGMKMNSYRYNLMQSTNTLCSSQEKVQTHRKFNSYAENPADATHAWRVRREFMDNYSYQRNNEDTYTRFQTAWLTAGSIKTNLEDLNGRTSTLRGENGATGSARSQLGNVMLNTTETIVQGMNGAKYGDEFVFSGSDGMNPPFSLQGDHLYYRGIDLTPPEGEKWPDDWGVLGEDGIPEKLIRDPDTNDVVGAPAGAKPNDEWLTYFKNVETLNKLSKEEELVDLGMGMKSDGNGGIVDGTAFNTSIPGINFLGYGVDDNGDPKNVVLLMRKIGHIFEACSPETGEYDGTGAEDIERLSRAFDLATDSSLRGYTSIDTQASFLKANQTNLEDQSYNLNTEIAGLEQVDMADAITAFMWDYSCYNASLKIGTQLLSQSLLDYMR